MPLDSLIPIASGNGGSKRVESTELTGGLISISGPRDNVNVDMSEFNVDELLGDHSKKRDKSKTKLSDKKTQEEKKKKKKKKGGNETDEVKTSKKKTKSKVNKSSFDDDDPMHDSRNTEEWTTSTKIWDSAAELEMAAAARRKKENARVGESDDEVAKILGNIDSEATFGRIPLSPKPVVDTATYSSEGSAYKPTMYESKTLNVNSPLHLNEKIDAHSAAVGTNEGLGASFFQDDANDLKLTSLSSFLGPTTERRGGSRGGRRNGASVEADPFGFQSSTTTSSIAFDSLFGASGRRRTDLEDPLAKATRDQVHTREQSQKNVIDATKLDQTRNSHVDEIHSHETTSSRPNLSAKDHLLADLVASESQQSGRDKQTSLEHKLTVEPSTAAFTSNIALSNALKHQNDVSTDLLTTRSSSVDDKAKEEKEKGTLKLEGNELRPFNEKISSRDQGKQSLDPTQSFTTSKASAKESLLMDLLGDRTPPKPQKSRQDRHYPNIKSLHENEVIHEEPVVEITAENTLHAPSPSSERPRSSTMVQDALVVREKDSEQSKDGLFVATLPSSPSVSSQLSYSQAFDVEDSTAADPVEAQTHSASMIIEKTTPLAQHKLKAEQDARTLQSPTRNATDTSVVHTCNCVEREAKLKATFDVERLELEQSVNHLREQIESQATSNHELMKQAEEREKSCQELRQQLEARTAANAQLLHQVATIEREALEAQQSAAASKADAANLQHRAEFLETEIQSLRDELSRTKRAVQDAELTLARKVAEEKEAEQFERHREKRALEALSAQMQRALARLTVFHQVEEENPDSSHSAARVAAEDEARLRVIASLEGSSKRAAQSAEQERVKLSELLRELEAGARNARQGTLEDKERLRQEQQRLDALSAHLQAQATALRDQEAAHAAYMGKQLTATREDARVYEARLATRRSQVERDERTLYEARADFAAFREQSSLEMEREHESLRASRLALEEAWRELRADREDFETELASHEEEFQTLESMRTENQEREVQFSKRFEELKELAENLNAGTRELLAREQVVAERAAQVQDTDASFMTREQTLKDMKRDLRAREERLHVQIRQLDHARKRFTQQRLEQRQGLKASASFVLPRAVDCQVDKKKSWTVKEHERRQHGCEDSFPLVNKLTIGSSPEEDPSGLSPALRNQIEAHWERHKEQRGQRLNERTGHWDKNLSSRFWST